MNKLRLDAWKLVIGAHWAILTAGMVALVYFSVTGSFSGVDGGIGLVYAAGWLVVFFVYVCLLYLMRKITHTHRRASLVALGCVCVVSLSGLVAVGIIMFRPAINDEQQQLVKKAFNSCSITEVDWQNDPAQLQVQYKNSGSYVFDGQISPTLVDGLVRTQESKCNSKIRYLIDGKVPANRQ